MQVHYSLNCKGRLLSLSNPIIMGIINTSPESFFTESIQSSDDILKKTEKMLTEGATIIDIGGMSSKPGAEEISEDTEIERVIPILLKIKENFPEPFISIDTYRSKVAKLAIEAGADIINDIYAGTKDNNILQIAAQYKTPYIAMHMQGSPKNMQQNPSYQNATEDIYTFFSEKIHHYNTMKINDVIIDVGFGFGKTVAHNFELLYNLSFFKTLHKPILAGISRKSMICKPLQIKPNQALNGTTALHMLALQNGANILRVHDVKEAMECIKLYQNYIEQQIHEN